MIAGTITLIKVIVGTNMFVNGVDLNLMTCFDTSTAGVSHE